MKLKLASTWRLLSGDEVTILSVPDRRGWLECYSEAVRGRRIYNVYGFVQQGVVQISRQRR